MVWGAVEMVLPVILRDVGKFVNEDGVAALLALPPEAWALLAPVEDAEQDRRTAELVAQLGQRPATVQSAALCRLLEAQRLSYVARAGAMSAERTPCQVLRALMRQRGLCQGELARELGTTQATVSRLVNGQMTFTVPWMQRLAAALDVDVREFFR